MGNFLPFLIALILVFEACSVNKYIPEGEKFYTGSEVNLEAKIYKKRAV